MDSYNKVIKDIIMFKNNKAIFMCVDSDDLHRRKMELYKSGKITKQQALCLEKRIDNILAD